MTELLTLQRLALPDPDVAADPQLYLVPEAGLDVAGTILHLASGAVAQFGTWANLLNLTNWQNHCALDGLYLQLAGQGRLALQLRDFGTEQCLYKAEVNLTDGPATIDLEPLLPALAQGSNIAALRLVALTTATLAEGAFVTRATHARPARLAIGITTFRREAEVARTADRLAAFLAQTPQIGAATHVFVIDNGQSATITPGPHISHIPNVNLGGAGGFARALAAAEAGGFSHCLFMDDDASFAMENLLRTHAFLSLACDPRTALAGSMIAAETPWALWENGAVFDGLCRPQFGGTDLRNPGTTLMLEQAGSGVKPAGFYGGWWYFAFPVEGLRHHPYPFFVRGDDSAFSLSNDFAFATLNGVVSFQEDFGAKETPLIHYLDMRYHLHHPLVQPQVPGGRLATSRTACRMILRQLVRMHYGHAAAQLQGWRDLMQGPAFFEANADMAAKRAEIAAIPAEETWGQADGPGPQAIQAPSLWKARLWLITLNGHLVPGFGALAARRRISRLQRAFLWPIWGAAEVTVIDAEAGQRYTVRHSKRRFFALLWQLIQCLWHWNRHYNRLCAEHREGYQRLAHRDWWRGQFAKGPAPLQADDQAAETIVNSDKKLASVGSM